MKEKNLPRMADVAKAAGVHQTTVSRALRGDPVLPADTRERLTALAEKMGYRRNPLVSALIAERRRGKPSGHGAVLAALTAGRRHDELKRDPHSSYAHIHRSMEGHAHRLGYRLDEFALRDPEVGPDRLKRILLSRGIRGVILAPMPLEEEEVDFDFTDFAAVALRLSVRHPALDRVAPDYFSAMDDALQKLKETGHQKIGFLSETDVDERVRHRSLGAFLAAGERGLGLGLKPLLVENWSREDFFSWMREGKPDAVVTAIRKQYVRVEEWLREAGWQLPRDLSLVSLDCHRESGEAGIVHNLELEAVSAINLLAHKVESANFGVPVHACRLAVPGSWRDGELFRPRGALSKR